MVKEYVKLENNKLEYAPYSFKNEKGETFSNFKFNEELCREYGYKEFEENNFPVFNPYLQVFKDN